MAEPVTLDEAKAQCRMVEDDSEDTFIESLIAPARAFVERVSTYALVTGQKDFVFNDWGEFLEIYFHGIGSVDGVAYFDADGNDATYLNFVAPIGRYPFRVYPAIGDSFPALGRGGIITATVDVTAIDDTTPEYLIAKRCILLLIGHWFEFREAAAAGIVSNEIAFCITSMLDELRPVSAY